MKRPNALPSTLATLLLLGSACDPEVPESQSLRASDLDVDIALMQAESEGGSDDGTIVWEIVEAAAAEGGSDDGTIVWEIVEAAAADSGGDDGTVVWEIDGPEATAGEGGSDDGTIVWEIVEASLGATTCTISGRYLRDTAGNVLMTVAGNELYAGKIPESAITSGKLKTYEKSLRYTLHETDVWAGAFEQRLFTADAVLETASDARKLTIGMVTAGLCR